MGRIRIAGIIALFVAAQAAGQVTISFELGLGGDNHAAAIKAGTYTFFTINPIASNGTADGQQFGLGSDVTWDVRAVATGTHAGIDNPGTQYPIRGLANFVFDLELHVGTAGGPVAAIDFLSTIHDLDPDSNPGTAPCSDFSSVSGGDFTPLIDHCGRDAAGKIRTDGNGESCDPCFAAAAFAYNFDVSSRGPARCIDQWAGNSCGGGFNPNGGPNLAVFLYPTGEPGKLFGMGAGYSHWKTTGVTTQVRPGIGIDPAMSDMPGGALIALTEGQISASGLALGTYTLVLIPGKGINALRGDTLSDLGSDEAAFAVPVKTPSDTPPGTDTVSGDTITFEVVASICTPPTILAAVSRKSHGAGGDRDITIEAGATEPRQGGPDEIIITFSGNVQAADGTLDTEVTLNDGSVDSLNITDDTLTIGTSGFSDDVCLEISISGIAVAGDPSCVMDPVVLKLPLIVGDSFQDGVVNIGDIMQTVLRNGEATGATNFRYDSNLSGSIDIDDIDLQKLHSGHGVICP